LLTGLRGHRGPNPDPGTGDLPLGLPTQGQHRQLVVVGVKVDPASGLGHPQLDAIMLEQRRHRRVLAAAERALVFADHDRVPAPVRISQRGHQRRGLRAPRPAGAAACGRRAHAKVRLCPVSNHSATIRPRPATSAAAWSRCRTSDVTGSCQSSVDTRP
jgi:hypothetical protein